VFADWREEAEFWDQTDTAPFIENEEGEWIGPGRVQAAPNLCPNCGNQLERHFVDVTIAHGRIILHAVEMYSCPHCGMRRLPEETQDFVAWSEAGLVDEAVSN
jgi:YgiT-type zinc finger domain-containing protein